MYLCTLIARKTVAAMNTMELMDTERIAALSYVVGEKYGYVRDLVAKVKQNIVDEFVSLGFVIMGYTPEDKTWRVSDFAVSFYNIVK